MFFAVVPALELFPQFAVSFVEEFPHVRIPALVRPVRSVLAAGVVRAHPLPLRVAPSPSIPNPRNRRSRSARPGSRNIHAPRAAAANSFSRLMNRPAKSLDLTAIPLNVVVGENRGAAKPGAALGNRTDQRS